MDRPSPPADLKDFQPDRSLDEIRKSVFLIETDRGTGTGFLIDDNTIATDYHVVRNTRQISAIGHDGRVYKLGAQVAFDNANDLAVLTFAGERPRDCKPLTLGASGTLKPGDKLYSLGHAGGGPARWDSGHFLNMVTHRDWLTEDAAHGGRYSQIRKETAFRHRDPALLNLPLVLGKIPVTNGCSGGPIFNERGEVVSVVRMGVSGDPQKEFGSPAERLRDLYAGRADETRFELRSGYTEPNILTHMKRAEHDPVTFTVANAGLLVAGRGAFRLAGYSPDPMCLITRSSAIRNGVAAGAFVGWRTAMDGIGLYNAADSYDTAKFSLSLASDGIMAGGVATSYLGVLRAGGAGRVGKMLMIGGALGRLACEFIPNNYTVDIGKTAVYP